MREAEGNSAISPSVYGRCLKPLARLIFKRVFGASTLEPAQARKRLNAAGDLFKSLKGVRRIDVKAGAVQAQWLVPDSYMDGGPVLLYLHGGAYVSGSIRSHWELAARLASASGARCLIIDYRLAPEHPFPAALEDSVEVWDWLLQQGLTPGQIVLAGDSAGGGLCFATALRLRELGHGQPAGIYCLSPWIDLALSGSSNSNKQAEEVVLTNPMTLAKAAADYASSSNLCHPLISPLYADLTGLPRVLIHVGTEEVLLDDAVRLQQRLLSAKVDAHLKVWRGMWHVWPIFARLGLPEANRAIFEAGRFIHSATIKQPEG